MKKMVFLLVCVSMFRAILFAQEITIKLSFPKTGSAKADPLQPRSPIQTVSGVVTIDITPYPRSGTVEAKVKYFVDSQEVFTSSLSPLELPNGTLSYKYALDTTLYPNGKHQLIANYSDSRGSDAIGICDIQIANNQDTQCVR